MKKTIVTISLALASIGSSLVYAQSFDTTTNVVSSSINITTEASKSMTLGCNPPTRYLRSGDGDRNMRKEEVKKLQIILLQDNYMLGTATGYFGTQTLMAVKKFQVKEAVSATGYVGPLTLERLRARCGVSPIVICDYAAPPRGCTYTPGPGYNKNTQCGLVLECAESEAYTPPVNCQSWNDGCNTCSRQTVDNPAACTKRACIGLYMMQPKCNAYFEMGATCGALGKTYTEGQNTSCIDAANGQVNCIADATHVCRNGIWKIEGSLPQR